MIALQSRDGLVFGTAQSIDHDMLFVVVAANMDLGASVEFRLELPGLEVTALGMVRVLSQRGEKGTAPTFQLQVLSVAPDDKELFEIWRTAVAAGNIAASSSRHSSPEGWAEASANRGTTPEERAYAVKMQEERRLRLQQSVRQLVQSQKKGWPDPRDLQGPDPAVKAIRGSRSSLTPRPVGSLPPASRLPPPLSSLGPARADTPSPPWPSVDPVPTASARSALAPISPSQPPKPAAASPPPAPAPAPPSPEAPPASSTVTPAPTDGVPPAAAAPALSVAPPPSAAPPAGTVPSLPSPTVAADPRIAVRPGVVEFGWQSAEQYAKDHRESLRFRGLFVPGATDLVERARVAVILVTPEGGRVTTSGEVVNVSPAGAAIQFDLDAAQAKTLVPGG